MPLGGVRTMVAKKRETRKSIQQKGWIMLEGGFAARPCHVMDLSASGAKIMIDDGASLTSKFRLGLSRDAKNARACEIVWRRGKTVGLRYV